MFRRAFQRKFLLFILLVAFGAAAVGYSHLHGGQYRATARIEIEPALDGGITADQYFQRQYALLGSHFLAERVVSAEGLAEDPAFLAAFGLDDATPAPSRLAALVADSIAIEPVAGSQLVEVVARSPDPEVSARIANSWADQFVADNFEKRFGHVGSGREQLRQQMEEQRLTLARAEAALAAYADQNDVIATPQAEPDGETSETATIANARLARLNQAVIDASLRRIEARSALDERRSAPDLDAVTALRNRRSEALQELGALALPEGQQTARSQALQAEIAALDRQIERADAQVDPLLQADYELVLREEEELRAQFEAEQAAMLAGRAEETEYAILQRDVETNRQLYEALLQRYAALGPGDTGQNNMTVVDRAAPPVAPDGPSLPTAIAMALAAAVATWLVIAGLLGKPVAETEGNSDRF